MSELKKQEGIMSKPTENEETSFMARLIPDLSERRAAGQIVRDALVGFSTLFGNPATQLGAMQEEEAISDERTALAIQAGNQRLKVVNEENEKRAAELEKIKDRGRGFETSGTTVLQDPMFKHAMNKYIKKTGKTVDLTDSNLKRNLGKRFLKLKRDGFNTKTAIATITNEIYTARYNPEITLFEKDFKAPLADKTETAMDRQMSQVLKKPKGVFGRIAAQKPENVVTRIAESSAELIPKSKESIPTDTSEIFPVMDPSGIFRVKREIHSKIASFNKVALSYENERSDKPIYKEKTGNKTNDLAYAKAATELVDFVVDAGYGEEDSDKVFRDVLLIVQNAAPRKDDSQQEQKDLNNRVAQIKSKLALMDNRFDKRRLIEQLKKGEGLPKKTEKPVVNNNTIVRTAIGATSKDPVGSYLYKTHNSNPNIKQIDDTNYSITVTKDIGNYPVGTVLNVKVKDGEVLNISDTGQKADVVPLTYEEWKALPEETPQQQKAKLRFMNNIPEIRARVIEENRKKIEENRKKKDQQ